MDSSTLMCDIFISAIIYHPLQLSDTHAYSWDQKEQAAWEEDLRCELGVLSSLEGGLWKTSL